MNKMVSLLFVVTAVLAGIGAAGLWYVFLRPVPEKVEKGVIVEKVFQPAHTKARSPSGTQRQNWSASDIPIPDMYVFSIRMSSTEDLVHHTIGAVAATAFEEGQSVRITYQRRGFGALWHRSYVLNMELLPPLESESDSL